MFEQELFEESPSGFPSRGTDVYLFKSILAHFGTPTQKYQLFDGYDVNPERKTKSAVTTENQVLHDIPLTIGYLEYSNSALVARWHESCDPGERGDHIHDVDGAGPAK